MKMHRRYLGFCSRVIPLLSALLAFSTFSHFASAQHAADNASAAPETAASATDPVADPRAVVIDGHARFTVLTPQMIRMEWAADGKFEDHASFVFLNRHLPVPEFQHTRDRKSTRLNSSHQVQSRMPSSA